MALDKPDGIVYDGNIQVMTNIDTLLGFDWDEGNFKKSWLKHEVSPTECETVFFNQPIFVYPDVKHSATEARWYALGHTDEGRLLFIAFTLRQQNYIRIISARPMNKKEQYYYEKNSQKNSSL